MTTSTGKRSPREACWARKNQAPAALAAHRITCLTQINERACCYRHAGIPFLMDPYR